MTRFIVFVLLSEQQKARSFKRALLVLVSTHVFVVYAAYYAVMLARRFKMRDALSYVM